MSTAADIADLIAREGYGVRMRDTFTVAEVGQYDTRAVAAVIKDTASGQQTDVTIDADYGGFEITVSGTYGVNGDGAVHGRAEEIYRLLRLRLDERIGDREYHYIRVGAPPVHAGFDEKGRTQYTMSGETFYTIDGKRDGKIDTKTRGE